jgi:hypothetical protein
MGIVAVSWTRSISINGALRSATAPGMSARALPAPALLKGVKSAPHFHASPQRFGPKFERNVADFVQEKRAMMGQTEPDALAPQHDNLSDPWIRPTDRLSRRHSCFRVRRQTDWAVGGLQANVINRRSGTLAAGQPVENRTDNDGLDPLSEELAGARYDRASLQSGLLLAPVRFYARPELGRISK